MLCLYAIYVGEVTFTLVSALKSSGGEGRRDGLWVAAAGGYRRGDVRGSWRGTAVGGRGGVRRGGGPAGIVGRGLFLAADGDDGSVLVWAVVDGDVRCGG